MSELEAKPSKAAAPASLEDRLQERILAAPRIGRLAQTLLQRTTPSGKRLLVVLLVAGLVSVFVGLPYPVYWLAIFLFNLLTVDWFVGLALRPRVEIARDLPSRCAAGARVAIRARVTNTGRLPAFDLSVTERIPSPPLRIEAAEERRAFLAPGETLESVYTIEPTRRGAFDFDGPVALAAFPFGLYQTGRRVPAPARLLVYPRFAPLQAVDLPVGRKHQPGGLQLVSEVGDSGEYIGNREYRAGDRLRDIHHAAWARLGSPVVREFQQEYLCRIALIVDTHVPSRDRLAAQDLEAAISLGAAVADVLSRQEYVVDVFAAGPDLYHFQAGRSLAYLDNILDVLACIEGCRENPFERLAPALQDELGQISTAVAVLLDWDETRLRFVRSLEEVGVAVKAVVVRGRPPSSDPAGFVTLAGAVSVFTPEQVASGIERL
ncbi:DUF58 domain-containing protein [bacterium]|nr:DUF58 domain-containing protein [bacterium]